jgi:hypothetical protein
MSDTDARNIEAVAIILSNFSLFLMAAIILVGVY